jgi:hypothetical protein
MYFSPTVLLPIEVEVKLGLQIGGRLQKITNSKPLGAMIMIGHSLKNPYVLKCWAKP